MNTNSLSFQLGTSVAQYLMQYGQNELNYEEFKAGYSCCRAAQVLGAAPVGKR